jgi:hypothetical protein
MGDSEYYANSLWQVVQGDALCYFTELFCQCPMVPDITGYQFFFIVKASLDSNDPNTLLAVLWTELHGACGYTCLIVIPDLTSQLPVGRFAFDYKYRTPSNLVTTIARGELDVLPSSNVVLSEGILVPPATSGPSIQNSQRWRQVAAARLLSSS